MFVLILINDYTKLIVNYIFFRRLDKGLKENRQRQLELDQQKNLLDKAKKDFQQTKSGLDYQKLRVHDDRLGVLTRDINELRRENQNLKGSGRNETSAKVEKFMDDMNDRVNHLEKSITRSMYTITEQCFIYIKII